MANWTEEETVQLISLWGEESIQDQLEQCSKNRRIYDKISAGMKEAGYERTTVQCRDKIKKLRGFYKKAKDHNGLTGRGTRKWLYFDQLDAILGHKPASRPPIVLDTLDNDGVVIDGEVEVGENESTSKEYYEGDDEGDDEDGDDISEELKERKVKVKKEGDEIKEKPTRKRPTSAQLVEKAIGKSMKKLAKVQEESDERFINMEEKRLKFDERVFEIENQRCKEERTEKSSGREKTETEKNNDVEKKENFS